MNLAYCRRLFSAVLGGLAFLGCGDDGHGPPPPVTLSIQGDVTTAGPNPLPVTGARVELQEIEGWINNPLPWTTTDHAGHYRLEYTYQAPLSQEETSFWIEASALGYWMASTHGSGGHFSDPPIYYTSELQVVNLTLRAPPIFIIRGQIVSAGPDPAPVPDATVSLQRFYNPETLATTTADEAGNFELSYKYVSASPCEPTDATTYIIEASAEGYITATTAAADPDGPFVSDPPIYCTGEPQVINLSLQPAADEMLGH